jgi:hypothetical protein
LLLTNLARQMLGPAMTVAQLEFLLGAARLQAVAGSPQGPAQYLHAVRQQTAVGRIMDVGFDDAAIGAQFAPGTHTLLLRQAHDPIIDAMQCLRTNQTLACLERTMVRAGVVSQRTENPPLQAAVDFVFRRAIAPVFQAARDGGA